MKILAVGSHVLKDTNKQSQVDWWRLGRPMAELAKHCPDWIIDHSASYIPGFKEHEGKDQFTSEEFEKAFKKISQYDIVYSSYHPDPSAYTLLQVARDKTGTQFILDCDDNMFAINEDNPFWMKMTDEKVYWMQRMVATVDWLTTPSPVLAEAFRERRTVAPRVDGEVKLTSESVTVLPNLISKDYAHPDFDHGDDVVIGYFGGSSHYADLHESGVLEAIEKLMNQNKKVRFKSVGMLVDKYIPKGRFEFDGGKRGTKWLTEIFPKLEMDIAIGPLLDNTFNHGKSNIKWQEATRANAVFVASKVGPYAALNPKTAVLVENTTDAWYTALKELVDNKLKRRAVLHEAKMEVESKHQLEKNWGIYKLLFERVAKHKKNSYAISEQGVD